MIQASVATEQAILTATAPSICWISILAEHWLMELAQISMLTREF
jgi:hypothetical protein